MFIFHPPLPFYLPLLFSRRRFWSHSSSLHKRRSVDPNFESSESSNRVLPTDDGGRPDRILRTPGLDLLSEALRAHQLEFLLPHTSPGSHPVTTTTRFNDSIHFAIYSVLNAYNSINDSSFPRCYPLHLAQCSTITCLDTV